MNSMMVTMLAIIWAHWIADFVLQTDYMAKNKSSSMRWLSIHVAWYTLPFILLFGWKYALANGAAHWIVDFVTSKVTSKMWKEGRTHDFFVVVGLDQAIHLSTLLLTMPLITG